MIAGTGTNDENVFKKDHLVFLKTDKIALSTWCLVTYTTVPIKEKKSISLSQLPQYKINVHVLTNSVPTQCFSNKQNSMPIHSVLTNI